jgi:hypothetical protein
MGGREKSGREKVRFTHISDDFVHQKHAVVSSSMACAVLWGCRIFQVRKMGLGEDSVYLYFYFT